MQRDASSMNEMQQFMRCASAREFGAQILDLVGTGSPYAVWAGYIKAVAAQTGRDPGEFLLTFRRKEEEFPTLDYERYRLEGGASAKPLRRPAQTTQVLEGLVDLSLSSQEPLDAAEQSFLKAGFATISAFNHQVFERRTESFTHPERYIVGTRRMPNRQGLERFVHRWKELHEENGGSALASEGIYFILDVDMFKPMNTEFGYDETNRALSLIGRTIIAYCRENATWGKWYAANDFGDEFSWVLLGVNAWKAADHVTAMRERIAQDPIILERQGGEGVAEVRPSTTIGWEELHPASDFHDVKRNANYQLTRRKLAKEPYNREIMLRYLRGLPAREH